MTEYEASDELQFLMELSIEPIANQLGLPERVPRPLANGRGRLAYRAPLRASERRL